MTRDTRRGLTFRELCSAELSDDGDESRPWLTSIYRNGKLIMGDSNDCYTRALMYPSFVSEPLLPTDVIEIAHISGRQGESHLWRDHPAIERRYFSS